MMCKKSESICQKRNRELFNYIFWGIISAVLNVALFQFLVWSGIDYKVSNFFTLMFVKIFCYVTNKIFVFQTRCDNFLDLLKEMMLFIVARIATFLLEYFGVIFCMEVIRMDSLYSKIITSIFVVVINYLLSKLVVFKNTELK